jgi:hypothetical protein
MMNIPPLEHHKISNIHQSISCVACELEDVGQGSGNLRNYRKATHPHLSTIEAFFHHFCVHQQFRVFK